MLQDRAKTYRLALNFLSPYQAQKEITVNENLNKIDLLFNRAVLSFTKEIDLDSLKYGDLLIVPENADGEMLNYRGDIILFTDEPEYISAEEGMIFWALREKSLILCNDKKKWTKIL